MCIDRNGMKKLKNRSGKKRFGEKGGGGGPIMTDLKGTERTQKRGWGSGKKGGKRIKVLKYKQDKPPRTKAKNGFRM